MDPDELNQTARHGVTAYLYRSYAGSGPNLGETPGRVAQVIGKPEKVTNGRFKAAVRRALTEATEDGAITYDPSTGKGHIGPEFGWRVLSSGVWSPSETVARWFSSSAFAFADDIREHLVELAEWVAIERPGDAGLAIPVALRGATIGNRSECDRAAQLLADVDQVEALRMLAVRPAGEEDSPTNLAGAIYATLAQPA